ncbi:MAG: gamma-glutamyltransferase, partial [Candidatus Thiodiazotropha sp.]
GASMLEKGGNAIDAAVATSLALGACEPAGSGLGGMAMAVVHMAQSGRTFSLTAPCRAPALATPEMVARGERYRTYTAVAVPSMVSALDHLHSHYGTLTLAELMQPAIQIAEQGNPLTQLQHDLIQHYCKAIRKGNTGNLFLDLTGEPYKPGHMIRQPQLAETLGRLADRGLSDFYQGDIAQAIARDMEQNGGYIRLDDLRQLPPPIESTALTGTYNAGQVFTLGPPGGGMVLIEMLNLCRAADEHTINQDTAEGIVRLAKLIQRARKDRRKYRLMIQPDSIGTADRFLSNQYASDTVARLDASEQGETSHLNVMDRFGNAISMTQSIERSFGAAVATQQLGFLYNGFLRAFKVENKRHPYYLRPGAMARSNASPTLVLFNGKPWIAIGSTGSERIASGICEVLLRLSSHPPFEASHAPRMHCTPEGLVLLEADRYPAACIDALVASGFAIKRLDPYAFAMGGLQLIIKRDNGFCGVSEPRRDGAAIGI